VRGHLAGANRSTLLGREPGQRDGVVREHPAVDWETPPPLTVGSGIAFLARFWAAGWRTPLNGIDCGGVTPTATARAAQLLLGPTPADRRRAHALI
jgi:hypothetical protein